MSSEGIILLTPSVRVTIRDRNKLLVSEDRNGGGAGGGGGSEGGGLWFAAFQAS